jgi:type II secretory pathway pseudopilin PulG
MKRIRSRPGFTVLEVMVAAGIFMMIFAGGYTLLDTSMKSFRRTRAQTNSDVDAAVLSMQRMVDEVREAKTVTVLNSGTRMQLIYPLLGADGHYDRMTADPASLVEYYQSDSTGAYGQAGTWLWRKVFGGTPACVCRNIEALTFTSDTPRSVRITVRSTHALFAPDAGSVTTDNTHPENYAHTDLVQRVVFLRNF